jgi:hypothetical protein
LDNKAQILSQYINVSHPIKYSPSWEYRPHYNGYMHSQYEQSSIEMPSIYELNFTIPISICERVLYDRDPNDLANNCEFSKQVTEINMKPYIETIYTRSGEKIKQIQQRNLPFFIAKLIGYIEQKIGISILDPRLLELSTKIQEQNRAEQWERERPQREAEEKRKEAEYNCIRIKNKKEKLVQDYQELVTTFVKIQDEQEARHQKILEMHKQGTEEVPKLIAEYNEKCLTQGGGRRRRRGKTAKRRQSRKQTIRRHKRRTN